MIMKKSIIFSVVLAGAGLLTSCDMDKYPAGQIDEEEAIQSVNDAFRFRNGLYTGMRAFASSGFFTAPEIQMDMFHGIVINGNRGGLFANGTIYSNNEDIESYWASLYSLINNANFFIERAEPLLDAATTEDEHILYERYLGEAHFARAYYYAEMFDRFCQVYSEDKGDTPALGLPLVSQYRPTPDRASYPGRSTMNQTLKFIDEDLTYALNALLDYEKIDDSQLAPMATYLSSNVVKALQARIALWTSDYKTAKEKSLEVINSELYPLVTTGNYKKMWLNDTGSEILFLPFESADELGNAIGLRWLSIYGDAADYIPTPKCIDMYKVNGIMPKDVREESFISERTLTTAFGDIVTPCFNKFPGNPSLEVSSTPNVVNMPKPFRISELYLIAAEAAYETDDPDTANDMLDLLRKNRITMYKSVEYSGVELRDEIRAERTKELIGEGFRMSDLRRWKIGFSRVDDVDYASYPEVSQILVASGTQVQYQPDDHRYTWPIPSGEIQSNPQLKGQQNPDYD